MTTAIIEFLHQQQIGILTFLCVLCSIAFINVMTIKRLKASRSQKDTPMVSALVPARNEARNIEPCLISLLDQDYDPFEVIVLDDESTDDTPEIIAHLSSKYPRLRVLSGKPLPPGWLGKNWACYQLSQAAVGELFLFVDADTRHHPRMLAEAVATLNASRADLLTGMPRQEMKTWGERLVLPVLSWAVLSFYPIRLFQKLPFPGLAIAIGQFMFFRRSAYELIGGHAAIRSSVIDDFALVRRVKKYGLSWEHVRLSHRVTCRMYANSWQVFAGLNKNLFAVFGYNLLLFLLIWLWLVIVFILPVLGLALTVSGISLVGFSPALALAAVGVSLVLWLTSAWYFRSPLGLACLYPLTIALAGWIAVHSALLYSTRRSVNWKDRPISTSQPRK